MYKAGWRACGIVWLAATGIAGCLPAVQTPREPSRQVPGNFLRNYGADANQPALATRTAQKTWQEFFSSPDLRALVETALGSNQELNVRLQEIIIAQNEVSARQGEYLPKIDARVGAVTSEDVASLAASLLGAARTTVVVGPGGRG